MDAMLMEQVLVNLLENAVIHGHGLTQIILRVTQKQDTAVFEIIDDGCGIAPERLTNLFTGHFPSGQQPADHTKRNTGIGLSVCATIIRAHGGTIQAKNLAAGGAVFWFTLNTEDITDEQ